MGKDSENVRLREAREKDVPWKKWGPYLSERQWGTVREDYSESGDAWNFFTHEQARSRAYRWGEDGLAGIGASYQTGWTGLVARIIQLNALITPDLLLEPGAEAAVIKRAAGAGAKQ